MGRNVREALFALCLPAWIIMGSHLFFAHVAESQTGQLGAGHVWGNSALTQAPGRDSTFSSLMGRYGQFYADEYGTTHNGTDDTAAIQAALNAASTAGEGVVYLGPYSYTINSANLIVPAKVSLSCPGWAGVQGHGNDYSAIRCSLYVNPTYTISVLGSIEAWILNKNTVPLTTARGAITMVSGFSGTGITIGGPDGRVSHSVIGGFSTCISSNGFPRPLIEHVMVDCTNGVSVAGAHDIGKWNDVEAWPFLTTNASWTFTSYAVSGVADNGLGLYRVTIPANILITGDTVWLSGIGGAVGANGKWIVTFVDATHIDLQGSSTAPATTGNTTINERYVSLTSIANVSVGQTVTGTGIPAGATVAAIWRIGRAISLDSTHAATATGAGVAITFGNAAYTTGGSAVIDVNQRAGTGISVTTSETGWCKGCFVYGYNTGIYLGVGASWTQFTDTSVDQYCPLHDPTSIGMLIDSTATANIWSIGTTNCYGEAIVVNTSSTEYSIFSDLILNNDNGLIIEQSLGHASYTNIFQNTGNAIGFGVGAQSSLLTGTSFPHAVDLYASAAIKSVIKWGVDNYGSGISGSPSAISANNITATDLLLSASTAASATLHILQGVTPTAPVNGDVWITTSGIFSQINGATQQLLKTDSPTVTTQAKISGVSPDIQMYATGAALDQKYWDMVESSDGLTLSIRADNDAFSARHHAIDFSKVAGGYNINFIRLFTGADILALNCDSTQHCQPGNTVAPTIASAACGALTNGAVVAGSNDQGMQITIGAAATTSCVVTFSGAWVNPPRSCELTPQNAAAANQAVTGAYLTWTASNVTITGAALANANYSIACH